jgi:two-component system chemotaxis sensor kinase CheA
MFENDPEVLAAFAEESGQRLADLENGLLELERTAQAPAADLLNAVFRDAHSLKAGAGLLGLKQLETAAHRLENVLDLVRARRLAPNDDVCQALLDGVDLLRERMAHPATHESDARLDALAAFCGAGRI